MLQKAFPLVFFTDSRLIYTQFALFLGSSVDQAIIRIHTATIRQNQSHRSPKAISITLKNDPVSISSLHGNSCLKLIIESPIGYAAISADGRIFNFPILSSLSIGVSFL